MAIVCRRVSAARGVHPAIAAASLVRGAIARGTRFARNRCMGMDHRWDDRLHGERIAREERELYHGSRVPDDEDVDVRERTRPRTAGASPWSIGAAHWDQRDLYTRDGRVDDAGYARGPAMHPEIGSYAYGREDASEHEQTSSAPSRADIYEHEAWPWLNYEHAMHAGRAAHEGLRDRIEQWFARVTGRPRARAANVEARPDEEIHESARRALARSEHLDPRDIELDVARGEVTLRGVVPDRASKRLAGRIVEACPGVVAVHNRLEIRRHDDTNILMPSRTFA